MKKLKTASFILLGLLIGIFISYAQELFSSTNESLPVQDDWYINHAVPVIDGNGSTDYVLVFSSDGHVWSLDVKHSYDKIGKKTYEFQLSK